MIKKLLIKKALPAILISFLVLGGCKKSSPQEGPKPAETKSSAQNSAVSKSLNEVVARSTSWNMILKEFYGKEMPNFQVTDIDGKVHNLADYKGKNVMVVMWATWCRPCIQEIPHLKALREIMDNNSLAILAISNEAAELVKSTAQDKGMNYTVISYQGKLPAPFSNITGYPSAFFIRPDGRLKLVTEGTLYLGETKSIILAE